MLQDSSARTFSKQLIEIVNGTFATRKDTGSNKLPMDFCTIIKSKNKLIDNIFLNISTKYKNIEWLSERAILASQNDDPYGLNSMIQQLLLKDLSSYRTIDPVCDANEVLNFLIEVFNYFAT